MTLPRMPWILGAVLLGNAAVGSPSLVASWTIPRLHGCALSEVVYAEDGTQRCNCQGHLAINGKTGKMICAGLCPPGTSMSADAASDEPVCMQDPTVEERLQRLEEKLDQYNKETAQRRTLALAPSDVFQALHARDCLRVTEFDAIEKVESCGCQVPKQD